MNALIVKKFISIDIVDCTYRHGKGVGGGVDGGGVGGGGQAVHLRLHRGDDDPGHPLNTFDVVRPAAALGHVLHPHLGHKTCETIDLLSVLYISEFYSPL